MLADLAVRLTDEYGKGFDERNIRNMRAFYLAFPIRNALRSKSADSNMETEAQQSGAGEKRDALRPELSWTHYPLLTRVSSTDNEGKSRVRRIDEGVEFLGFTCLQDRLRLSRRNVKAMRKRMRRLHRGFAGGEIAWPAVERSLAAWNAHAGMGDTWRLRGDVYRAPFTADCMETKPISST